MRILNTNRNIFDLPANNSAVCVTTNGIIKQNGYAVMGKGIACLSKSPLAFCSWLETLV